MAYSLNPVTTWVHQECRVVVRVVNGANARAPIIGATVVGTRAPKGNNSRPVWRLEAPVAAVIWLGFVAKQRLNRVVLTAHRPLPVLRSNLCDPRALFAGSPIKAMYRFLQILTLLLVAIVMGLSLAHVLEWPGKRRLNRETYLAVQRIYYPGFTYGGVAEPAGILAAVALLMSEPAGSSGFLLTLVACIALVAMQAVFWLVTQPVNKFWLADEVLDPASARFFGAKETLGAPAPEWTALRNRWEYSHLARALLALTAYVLLLIATVL